MVRGLSRRLVCGAALSLALLAAAGCGLGGSRKSPSQPAPSSQSAPAPAGNAGTGTGTPAKAGANGTAGGATGGTAAGTGLAVGTATLVRHYTANVSANVQAGQALKMVETEFKFTPNTVTAAVGKPVTIALSNKGSITHNFRLDAFNVSVTLPPGHTTTVKFTPNKAGTYYFYCDIPGHVQAGMVGKLIVK